MEENKNEYSLVEPIKTKSKWKYVLFFLFAIVIILISAYFGIKHAQEKMDSENLVVEHKPENKEPEKEVTLMDIPKIDIPKIEMPEIDITLEDILSSILKETPTPIVEENKNRIPVFTEVGQENVKRIYSSTPDEKRVFLTFDDGPSSNITPLILDVLKENNIKATFFTLGSKVVQNSEIVKRAYEEGHYIANHGYSHVYANIYESEENLLAEYNQTEEAIRNAIEVPEYSSHLFRFPGGSIGGKYNNVKKEYTEKLAEHEILYVDWNCLNEDSMGKYTKEQLVQFIKDTSVNKNSVVVLMHDAGDKILTYETLQEVIDYFKENGYTFYNFYDIIDYELK